MPQYLAPTETGLTAYIQRLSLLIGLGLPVPATIPPEEIEQAKLHLLEIGIAAPVEVRPSLHRRVAQKVRTTTGAKVKKASRLPRKNYANALRSK